MITFMEWKNAGAELPPKWKLAVSAHNKKLVGKKGLGRYAWCVAAHVLLCLPPERLRELAARLRDEAERDWETFHDKWDNYEQTVRKLGEQMLAEIDEALQSARKKARPRRTKKHPSLK